MTVIQDGVTNIRKAVLISMQTDIFKAMSSFIVETAFPSIPVQFANVCSQTVNWNHICLSQATNATIPCACPSIIARSPLTSSELL